MLARANRIVTGADFRAVTRRGRKRSAGSCLVYIHPTAQELPARFGFIVSKAVGNAVLRNRVRRRMRAAAYELVQQGARGADVVVRALPTSVERTVAEFATQFAEALGR